MQTKLVQRGAAQGLGLEESCEPRTQGQLAPSSYGCDLSPCLHCLEVLPHHCRQLTLRPAPGSSRASRQQRSLTAPPGQGHRRPWPGASVNMARFATAGLPLVLPHVSDIPASPRPVPGAGCPGSPCSGGRAPPAPFQQVAQRPRVLSHLALWNFYLPSNSCAFPTQDLFQVMSGLRLQTSLCCFSNS